MKLKMEKSITISNDERIVIIENGAYRVYGGVPVQIQEIVSNKEGMSWDWKAGKTFETADSYDLCRCGQSGIMPFCDSSHVQIVAT